MSFRFAHAFFRTTLYEETFTPRRIRLHQQVGQALEEVYGARLEDHASELAEHFSQSTERDDLQKALSYGETAAERAMSVFAYGEAVRLLEQALLVQEVLDPDDKARRCDLLLALGEAMMPAGDPLRVAEAVAPEAYNLAEELGDDRRASAVSMQAIWGLSRYGAGVMLGRPEYRMWAERADRLAAPETRERVFADSTLSWVRGHDGDHAERDALRDRALKLARQLDDPEALWVAALPNLSGNVRTPAQLEKGIRLAREVAEWPRAGVATNLVAWTLGFRARLSLMEGKRDQAEALWDEVEELGERTSDTQPVLLSLMRANLLSYMDGRLEESIHGSERFTDRAEELGSPVLRPFDAHASYSPLLHLGRAEEALAGVDQMESPAPLGRALCLAHLDRRGEAQETLDELVGRRDAEAAADKMVLARLSLMLELAVSLADRDAVAALAPRLAGFDKYAPPLMGSSDGRNLGGAAALLGDHEGACAHYQAALEVLTKVRHRPEIALTRLELAELLLDHYPEERAEALEHLDFAIRELRDMKMQPALERALSRREILEA